MNIQVEIKDSTSLANAINRAVLGVAHKQKKNIKTLVLLALSEGLIEIIEKKGFALVGKVVSIDLDIDQYGFSNIKTTIYTKENEFSLKTLRLKNMVIDNFLKVEGET